MSQPAPLEYAPRPSTWRRRGRWAVVLVLILAAGPAARHWWPDFNRWQSLARLRHAVLTDTVRFDGPVVSIDPTDGPDHWLNKTFARSPNDQVWQQASARLLPVLPRDRSGVLLFVHERASPSGDRRVVMIDYLPMVTTGRAYVTVDIRLFDPGTFLRPLFRDVTVKRLDGMPISGEIPGWPGAIGSLARIEWGHAFSLSVGRPDPADASQFLFDYRLDGRPGQLIGKLVDGVAVSFRTADGSPLPIRIGPLPATHTG